ncbi:hypothetical protein ScPMuIL_000658 [Solemya velum]
MKYHNVFRSSFQNEGCELSKENPSVTWSFEEEEEDTDFLMHTLFLKHAVLGSSAVKDERNIVEVETKNFDQQTVIQPFFSLTLGQNDVITLDLSFGHESPVTLRLKDGTGPIYLSGQQLVEFPPEDADMSQEETEFEETHIESEEESPQKAKSKKRKAATQASAKSKKGKMEDDDEDESEESAEDEEDDDEDMEEDDEDDDEDYDENDMESSPEKSEKKKGKKGKDSAKDKASAKKGSKPKPNNKKAKKPAAKKGKK